MKTYFLALNNTDFTVSGNTWTSSSFDLYSNRFYTNYSTYKSPYGLNELNDYTFVGTKLTYGGSRRRNRNSDNTK